MPGYNLKKDEDQIKNFVVEPNRTFLGGIGDALTGGEAQRFDVEGEYEVVVKNTGIIPVFTGSVNINSLEIEGKQVINDKTKSLPTLYGNQSVPVSFDFSITSDDQTFVSEVKKICNGESPTTSLNASLDGLILGQPILAESLDIESRNCNIPQSDNGSGGVGGGGGGGGGDTGGGTGQGTGRIIVENSPSDDGVAELTIEGEYDAWLKSFNWEFGDGSTASGRGVVHTYDSNGEYTVVCTVTDDATGNTLDRVSTTLTAGGTGQGGGGGGGTEEGRIEVVDSPLNDGTATFRLEGQYGAFLTRFEWMMGDGSTARGREVQNTYETNGSFNVICDVVDGGTGDTIERVSTTVRVTGLQTEKDIQLVGPTDVNTGRAETWRIEGDESGIRSYNWDMKRDDNSELDFSTTPGSSSVEYTYQDNGVYIIEVTAQGDREIVETLTKEVSVRDTSPLTTGYPSMTEAADEK
jgi:plastocyanin